ncbi:MAG: hypothetical protein M1371_02925 [Actinobacteria bacterium]|nr:hypothetical protein [Actinomycetota bacterium]
MDNKEKIKLIIKIARLYYFENLLQREITERLNISRTKISRYLNLGKKLGIIEIKINSPFKEDFSELEYIMEKNYAIKECKIVPTYINKLETFKEMGLALSNILERLLNDRDFIGIGWGSTLKHVTDNIYINKKFNDIKVIPIIGGLGTIGTGLHTNSVAHTLSNKLGGINYIINAPAVFNSEKIRILMQQDNNIREIFELSENCKVAIVGMGDLSENSTLYKMGNFKKHEISSLRNTGIIGDINTIFINKNGEYVENNLSKRILNLPLEKIKKIKNVIGIATGPEKIEVILAALKGKIINTLISDKDTISDLLKYEA